MTEQTDLARAIAIKAKALATCPSCSVTHRTEVDPSAAYKLANLGFSEELYSDVFPDRRALTDAVKAEIEAAAATCACGTTSTKMSVEPPATAKPPRPSSPRGIEMNLREEVLNAIPNAAREGVLKMALDHNIVDPNDPTWAMVALAWSATTAAATSRVTLDEAARLPDVLYKNVTAAGADLKAVLEAGIKAKADEAGVNLTNVILAASGHGADALKKAAAGLDMMASARAEGFVEQWKAAVSVAVEKQATTALRRSIARSWAAASFALLIAAGAGGAVALGGALLEHRLITVSDLRFYNPDPRRDATLHYNGPGQITEARTCPQRDQACLNIP